jgi:hypothetical protein
MAIDYDTLTELINDARQSREETERELDAALDRVRSLQRRQQELKEEEDAYTATLTRRFPDAQSDLPAVSPDSYDLGVDMPVQVDWLAMPRTQAVERAIEEITKQKAAPASPSEIEAWLRNHGRQDNRDEVGGALAHLNRTSKIRSEGRAQWVIAKA